MNNCKHRFIHVRETNICNGKEVVTKEGLCCLDCGLETEKIKKKINL